MKENLVLATPDISILNKCEIEYNILPKSAKVIKFKIKKPTKKAKLMITHRFSFWFNKIL